VTSRHPLSLGSLLLDLRDEEYFLNYEKSGVYYSCKVSMHVCGSIDGAMGSGYMKGNSHHKSPLWEFYTSEQTWGQGIQQLVTYVVAAS
jgi:hypothetical protein